MIELKIADLLLKVQFQHVAERSLKEVKDRFLPFLHNNSRRPDETLEVVFIRPQTRAPLDPAFESLIKECLERPLRKFPFENIYPSGESDLFRKAKPYFQNDIFYQFLKRMQDPKELIVYPVPQGWLVRDYRQARSCLLLKPAITLRKPLKSVSPALYFLIAQSLPGLNSIMLHGVGIRRKSEELLFLGGSGHGKSTLAKLLDQGDIICDDAIIVTQRDRSLSLRSTPFNQAYSTSQNKGDRLPGQKGLVAGFFLQKSERNFLENVSPGEAGSIILKNHIHFFRFFPEEIVQKAFFIISHICKEIPFYKLNFKKDPSLWQQIEDKLQNDSFKKEENTHE
jgi:hypothetical protein